MTTNNHLRTSYLTKHNRTCILKRLTVSTKIMTAVYIFSEWIFRCHLTDVLLQHLFAVIIKIKYLNISNKISHNYSDVLL